MSRRRIRVSPLLIVASLASLFLISCSGESTSQTTGANPGKIIFDQQCSICHGKTGKGDTMIANSYANSNLSDGVWAHGSTPDEIVMNVTEGIPRTPMRGFKGALDDEEIDQVVSYVLTLAEQK